jgi:outer membrane protein insertion porin family
MKIRKVIFNPMKFLFLLTGGLTASGLFISTVFGQGSYPSLQGTQNVPAFYESSLFDSATAPLEPGNLPQGATTVPRRTDEVMNNAQTGAVTIQEIRPNTNSSVFSPQQPEMVPLTQNYQYIDPAIHNVRPQDYVSEEIPNTWRMNSTQSPDPSQFTMPMQSINPAEIQQSQNAVPSQILRNSSDFDPRFVTGSENYQEQPISLGSGVSGNSAPFRPMTDEGLFAQTAEEKGLVPLDAAQEENSDEMVLEVLLEGNGGVPEDSIRKKIKTMAGRPFKAQMVEEDARTLLNTGSFSRVAPFVRKSDEGVTVVFRLLERPLIHFVKTLGNKRYTKEELKEEIGLKPGDPMDVSAVLEGKTKLETKYIMDGFNRVHIEILEGDLPSDRGVVFSINESNRQRILGTSFSGNSDISSGRLKTQIESKRGLFWYFGGEFTREKLDMDVQTLKDYYRNLGYFNAEIGREYEECNGYLGIDPQGSWVKVHFIISEGLRSKINQIKFLGNKIYTGEELEKLLKIKSGKPFDRQAVEMDKIKLKEKYGEKGYVYAIIKEDIRYLEQPGMIDIVYMIREGLPAMAADLKVQFDGDQTHTKVTTILDRLDIRPGQMVTRANILESERMLRYDKFLNTNPAEGAVPTIQVVPSDPQYRKALEEGQNFDDFEENEDGIKPLFRGQNPEKSALQPTSHSTSLNWETPSVQNGVIQAGYQVNAASQENAILQVQYADPQYNNAVPPYAATPYGQTIPENNADSVNGGHPAYYQYTPAPSTVSNGGNGYAVSPSTIPTFPRAVQTTISSDSPEFLPSTLAAVPNSVPPSIDSSIYNSPDLSNAYGSPFNTETPVIPPSSIPSSAIGATPITQGGYYGENSGYGTITQVGITDPWNDSTLNHPYNGPGIGRESNNLSSIPDYIPSDVVVRVAEGRTGSIMASLMVNSDSGLMGRLALQENNFDWRRLPSNPFRLESWRKAFRGGGQQFLIEAMPGENVQSYNAMWSDPRFLHTKYSLGLNGSYYTRYYDEWRERRLGGGVSLGRAWTTRFSTRLSFNATEVKIFDPVVTPWGVPPDIYDALGNSHLYGFGVTAAYDFRDSPMMPTEGGLISGNIEQVLGTNNFTRGGIDLRRYFMLHERLDRSGRWVLGLRSAASVTSDNTPVYERYFAGGASSLRGFEYRGVTPRWNDIGVGGNFEFFNSVELCFPLSFDDNIRGVAFIDSGTVDEDISSWKYKYRITAGIGLRLCIPAMGPVPIAFDFGVPLTKDKSDKTQIFSFTMQFMR